MSWNIALTDIDPGDIEDAAIEAYQRFKANYSDAAEVFPAMDEQFDVAVEMARVALLGTADRKPVVGDGNVNVTLSGHANPGHKPRQGWANDYVSVHVSSAVRDQVSAGEA